MKNSKKIIFILSIFLLFITISAVSAHESEYPDVVIENPISNSDVSGTVQIDVSVDDHYETQYVNFTVEGINDKTYIIKHQDTNPSDGWSFLWDTSDVSNGKYYIQARAINNLGLNGEYNILVTVNNNQKNSILTIENSTVGINQNNNIILELKDENNNPIINKELVVDINSNSYKVTTNNAGLAFVQFVNSNVGSYQINARFLGDNIYKSSNALGVVNVIPQTIIQNYATYLGGNGNDKGKGVYVDEDGYIYIAMETSSKDLKTTANAFQKTINGTKNLFISKFSPTGELVFSTFVGGSGTEQQKDLKIDKDGNIYIIGFTNSPNLPVTSNAYMGTLTGLQSAFLVVLKNDGSDLIYSTYLGGTNIDRAWAVVVDDEGNAYIQGITNSIDFPTTANAFQKNKDGINWDGNVSGPDIDFQNSFDLFISKINIYSGNLLYSTYFGGRGSDNTYGVLAVDKNGIVYFSGSTTSLDLPTTENAYRDYHDVGLYDTFITALDINNNKLLFSTYVGGNDTDDGEAMFIDDNGFLYFVGDTWSSNFPTTDNAYQKNYGGVGEGISGGDAFAMKIDTSNWNLIYSTYLGGKYDEGARAITVDSEGNLYIVGMTQSPDFPVTSDAYQKTKNGPEFISYEESTDYDYQTHDIYLSKLSADGSKLLYSTYYGGSSGEFAMGIALRQGGFVLQLRTYSPDMPVSDDAYQKTHGLDQAIQYTMLNRTNTYEVDTFLVLFTNPSFLTINSVTGNSGEKVTLTATLKEGMGNNLLSNKKVNFYVNGKYVGYGITDSKGVATFNYQITEKGGSYLYTATFEGDLGHDVVDASAYLNVPQSEVYLKMVSNQSDSKVGDTVKITYTLFNDGPDPATNTVFTFVVPDGLRLVSGNNDVGTYSYDPNSKTVTWTINSFPVGTAQLDLTMQLLNEGRFNLSPTLSTNTYDESISNVSARFLTVSGESSGANGTTNSDNDMSNNDFSNYSNDEGINTVSAVSMENTGNPIATLLLLLVCIFGINIKKMRR